VRTTHASRGGRAYINDIDYRESEDLRVSQGYKSSIPRYPRQSASSIHKLNQSTSRYGMSQRHIADERRLGAPSRASSSKHREKSPVKPRESSSASNEVTAYANVLNDLYPSGSAHGDHDDSHESSLVKRFDEWLRT